MNKISLLLSCLILITQSYAQELKIRPGDPEVKFDLSKIDPTYKTQVETWMNAGSRVGILPISNEKTVYVYSPSDPLSLDSVISKVWSEHQKGQIKLLKGTYQVNYKIHLRSNIQLYGESKDSVILLMGAESGISFVKHEGKNTFQAGLHQLTIQGNFGVPNDFEMIDAKPEANFSGIYFNYGAYDCWLDKINIINTGYAAINVYSAKHITVRDCYIERAWNKGAGGHGYVQVCGNNNLFYNNIIKKMRHIAIQGSGDNYNSSCRYNVFYKNKVEQDFNFHNKTGEHNLIEGNTVLIPKGLGSSYHAMMGPWSYVHDDPIAGTVVWGNDCVEMYTKERTFSDSETIYEPARHEGNNPFNKISYKPLFNTFYPVVFEEDNLIEFANLNDDQTIDTQEEYPLLLKVSGKFNKLFLKVDQQIVQQDSISPYHFNLAGLSNSTHTIQVEAITSANDTIHSTELSITTPNGINGTLNQIEPNSGTPTTILNQKDFKIKIFPNPFYNEIKVETDQTIKNCYLFDLLGNEVHHQVLTKGMNTIKVNDNRLHNKIYLLQLGDKWVKLIHIE